MNPFLQLPEARRLFAFQQVDEAMDLWCLLRAGVFHLRLECPPVLVAATDPWRMRMLVFSYRTRRENR